MNKIKKIIILAIIVLVVYLVISFITFDEGKILRNNILTLEHYPITTHINLNYVQNLEGPIKYLDRNGYTNDIFTINFIKGIGTMKITNFGIVQALFENNNLKAFEVAAEKIKNGEIEPIYYTFRMKSDDEEEFTKLNFKDIVFINTDLFDLEILSIEPPNIYEFTFERRGQAEAFINQFKGYKVKELDNTTGRPLTNKADDF